MKAVLVALNAKYIHSNLGVYCLYAYSRKKGISSDELVYREFTINQEMDDILGALYKEKAGFDRLFVLYMEYRRDQRDGT